MLLCVHPSLSLCVCVRALVHVSACIFIMHAWPEAAVLDCSWYGLETDPGYWQGGNWDSMQVAYGTGLGGK